MPLPWGHSPISCKEIKKPIFVCIVTTQQHGKWCYQPYDSEDESIHSIFTSTKLHNDFLSANNKGHSCWDLKSNNVSKALSIQSSIFKPLVQNLQPSFHKQNTHNFQSLIHDPRTPMFSLNTIATIVRNFNSWVSVQSWEKKLHEAQNIDCICLCVRTCAHVCDATMPKKPNKKKVPFQQL